MSTEKSKYLLIDTDAGSDDALALMMALAAHKDPQSPIHIVGIVCGHGNTSVENVVVNVFRTLDTVQEDNVPVFVGAGHPLVRPFQESSWNMDPFHGTDGFGDNPFPPLEYKDRRNYRSEHGVLAISRLAKEYAGKLTFVALAPLTNLAMVVRLYPEITTQLEAICIMGGNVEGEGNITVSAEFNFAVDPEAAYITLESYKCPIHLVPWEVTAKNAVPQDWRVNVLGTINSPQALLLNQVEKKILEKYNKSWICCDQFVIAALIEPGVIQDSMNAYCTVELTGNYARGLMIVDKNGFLKKDKNVTIATKLDLELAKKIMLWAVGGPYYKK